MTPGVVLCIGFAAGVIVGFAAGFHSDAEVGGVVFVAIVVAACIAALVVDAQVTA